MNKHAPHAHIAGEVAASGSRPANEVATRIIERLAADGYRIVPVDADADGALPAGLPIEIRIGARGKGIVAFGRSDGSISFHED